MRMLMLGNSLTAAHGLPDRVSELTGAEVVAHTRSGARLAEQLNPATALGSRTLVALSSGDFGCVVMQGTSTDAVRTRGAYLRSVGQLTERVHGMGAHAVLFCTWPLAQGSKRLERLGISREEMAREILDAAEEARTSFGVVVADVCTPFLIYKCPRDLYANDGVHPSEEGTRIASEVIAETILGVADKPWE